MLPTNGGEALVVIVELRRVSGAIDPMLIRGELLKTLGVRADVEVDVRSLLVDGIVASVTPFDGTPKVIDL